MELKHPVVFQYGIDEVINSNCIGIYFKFSVLFLSCEEDSFLFSFRTKKYSDA